MIDPRFFRKRFDGSLTEMLKALEGCVTGTLTDHEPRDLVFEGVASLSSAGAKDLAFFDNPRYLVQLKATRAGVVFLKKDAVACVPQGTIPVICADPYRDFAHILTVLYTDASLTEQEGLQEDGCIIKQGAIVHPSVQIGKGTVIGENTVIGAGVCIGRNTTIAPHVTISHAYIGDRVFLHPGVRIGQEGFGFAMSGKGHLKVPQLGRVIIQDDVDIGANTTIDRGSLGDTVIGEGSKLDNLIQIGHNVILGRGCVLAGQSALAGSVKLEDFVVVGGQSCIAGHLTIHAGARIAGGSAVMHDIPAGATWAGSPARNIKTVFREHLTLSKLTESRRFSQN